MRIEPLTLIILALLPAAAPAQTITARFQFLATVEAGEELTITGSGLGTVTAVTLKATGKPDLAATNVTAGPGAVKFTVPPTTADGNYAVVLTPGSLPPIPVTVATPPTPALEATATAAPAAAVQPAAGIAPSATPSVATPSAPSMTTPVAPDVYMPDGQLRSHAIVVYLARDIQLEQQPCLLLNRSHELTAVNANEDKCHPPMHVASGQKWNQTEKDQDTEKHGTLLMFDLKRIEFGSKAMIRVRPVVYWNEGGKRQEAAGAREVNLENSFWIFVWTAVVVVAALLFIVVLSWRAKGNPLYLLTGVEGRLSLAQTQIALWTIAVGSVVLGYGMLRLEIPPIPNSLLVLMGASLATGGLASFGDARRAPSGGGAPAQGGLEAAPAPASPPLPLALRSLVLVFPPAEGELSLSKAQMLFWTFLLLSLFISKSLLDGAIWEVPWGLVALMGFSQAGFLVPKLASNPRHNRLR